MDFSKKLLFSFLLLIFLIKIQAQIPSGYYNNAVGKKDADLKTSLSNIINVHTQLEYYASSTYFKTTDWNPEGYFWDMYSNYKRASWSGMNREHSLPKSWWSSSPETTVAYSDLHNLYPSDADANMAKSNYPLGEVTGTPDFTNNVVKVGTNRVTGYNGIVFEPADEYKGDFARDYMYIVTCYQSYSNDWRSLGTSSMLLKNTYPVFNQYAISLLMKWHRNDPVSDKEINRNNAVYSFQNNRNPFIDFPVLAEYIWGEYAGKDWDGLGIDPEKDGPFYINYNPDTKALFVNATPEKAISYSVYTIGGILQLSGKINEDKIIDVSSVQKGMYLIVVYTNTTRKVGKFLVW